ncbi:hypothetical protein HMPREF9554_03154 [Treponema phagedenis F0421]|nr:hypothetical protein HMPREF9554_03154 [Treponema phagedenis F0421]
MAVVPSRRFSFCHGRQNQNRQAAVGSNRIDVLKHQHKTVN